MLLRRTCVSLEMARQGCAPWAFFGLGRAPCSCGARLEVKRGPSRGVDEHLHQPYGRCNQRRNMNIYIYIHGHIVLRRNIFRRPDRTRIERSSPFILGQKKKVSSGRRLAVT